MKQTSRDSLRISCYRLEQQIRHIWPRSSESLLEVTCFLGACLEQCPQPDLFEALRYLMSHRSLPESWGVDAELLSDLSETELFAAFANDQVNTARFYLFDRVAQQIGHEKALQASEAALARAASALIEAIALLNRH